MYKRQEEAEQMQVSVERPEQVEAPLEQGQQIGSVVLLKNGQEVSREPLKMCIRDRSSLGLKGTFASLPQPAQTAVNISLSAFLSALRASLQALHLCGSFWKPFSA